MSKCARYVIVLDRLDDDDYAKSDTGYGHDGSAEAAIEQVAAELEEAMNQTGVPAGFFNVIERRVIDIDQRVGVMNAAGLAAALGIVRRMESDPTNQGESA